MLPRLQQLPLLSQIFCDNFVPLNTFFSNVLCDIPIWHKHCKFNSQLWMETYLSCHLQLLLYLTGLMQVSIKCSLQNLVGSSRSSGYFSPTVFQILWIWKYATKHLTCFRILLCNKSKKKRIRWGIGPHKFFMCMILKISLGESNYIGHALWTVACRFSSGVVATLIKWFRKNWIFYYGILYTSANAHARTLNWCQRHLVLLNPVSSHSTLL